MRSDACPTAIGAMAFCKSTPCAGGGSQAVLCTLLLVLIASGTAAQPVSTPPPVLDGAPHCRPRQHPLAAVTLLHRPCSSLTYTLANFHAILGPTVPFFIKHAPGALRGLYESALVQRLRARCMLYTELLPRPIRKVEEYSEYMASLAFWNLPAEMVLTFQTDSALCSASRLGVRDFMQFSYVGAPWQHIKEPAVGNGGLSLRNQTVMRRVIAEVDYFKKRDPEDYYFAETVHKWAKQGVPGVVYPTRAQARAFSGLFSYVVGRPFSRSVFT